MTIKLCAISTDDLKIERLGFEMHDQPLTAAGYKAVEDDLRTGGSTARFRDVGAVSGDRIVAIAPLIGPTWTDTEANIRLALA